MRGIVKNLIVSDSELTSRAIAGERDAFAQIVSRYQSLVCSLAYSATGSLSQSEDLAQETFIAAWRGLRSLREPEKLRSWLCGIARNAIASALRRRKQEPSSVAAPLDLIGELPSSAPLAEEHAISIEEETILWRSLEHIPGLYREPLILFYREGESIATVAEALELSEEAVKQRLSRGRKLLKMEVDSFVEAALNRSRPGRRFTSAVLAGLPGLSLSASVSGAGAAASKGSVAVKTGALASLIAGFSAPLLGTLSGFLSMIGAIRSARGARERAVLMKGAVIDLGIFLVGMVGFMAATQANDERLALRIFLMMFSGLLFVSVVTATRARRLRKQDAVERPGGEAASGAQAFRLIPGAKGSLSTGYARVLMLTFGNPFAMSAVNAAAAGDSTTLLFMLALLAATFNVSRRIVFHRPERFLALYRSIMIAQLPALLILLHLRWERWTGASPWTFRDHVIIPVAVGVFLFAFAIVHWLFSGKRRRHSNPNV